MLSLSILQLHFIGFGLFVSASFTIVFCLSSDIIYCLLVLIVHAIRFRLSSLSLLVQVFASSITFFPVIFSVETIGGLARPKHDDFHHALPSSLKKYACTSLDGPSCSLVNEAEKPASGELDLDHLAGVLNRLFSAFLDSPIIKKLGKEAQKASTTATSSVPSSAPSLKSQIAQSLFRKQAPALHQSPPTPPASSSSSSSPSSYPSSSSRSSSSSSTPSVVDVRAIMIDTSGAVHSFGGNKEQEKHDERPTTPTSPTASPGDEDKERMPDSTGQGTTESEHFGSSSAPSSSSSAHLAASSSSSSSSSLSSADSGDDVPTEISDDLTALLEGQTVTLPLAQLLGDDGTGTGEGASEEDMNEIQKRINDLLQDFGTNFNLYVQQQSSSSSASSSSASSSEQQQEQGEALTEILFNVLATSEEVEQHDDKTKDHGED